MPCKIKKKGKKFKDSGFLSYYSLKLKNGKRYEMLSILLFKLNKWKKKPTHKTFSLDPSKTRTLMHPVVALSPHSTH